MSLARSPSAFDRISQAAYRAERGFNAFALLFMGVIVFLDVVQRVASREGGLLHKLLDILQGGVAAGAAPLSAQGWVNGANTAILVLINFFIVFGAFRVRGAAVTGGLIAKSAVVTGVLYGLVQLVLVIFPNGLVWSQTLGLVLMLWVGCMGASTATYENRHLALDLGSKLWPKSILPYSQAVGNFLTGSFCVVLAILSLYSLKDHHGDYSATHGAGGVFEAMPIPKYLAFLVIPISFTFMAIRFYAQMIDGFRGVTAEEDTLQMLGIKDMAGQGDGEPANPERQS
ncbi:MAG: hypothetical protein GMKNLPBB_01221 [Myxococcota bacterium]|nr:hypothetical protein [Myxococcota bacterium]